MTKPPFLDEDLYCTSCWYNLRGLRTNGACPECGHSIAETKRVRKADPSTPDATLGGICFVFGIANAIYAVIAFSDPISEFAIFGALFWVFVVCPLYFFGMILTLWLYRHRPSPHRLSRRAILLGLLFGVVVSIFNLLFAMLIGEAVASV